MATSPFYGQAQQQLNPAYNAKVQAMKNALAQNTLMLNQSKTGINQNFDNEVANQNLLNVKAKNNVSNTMLGRGLANSSIVTSGLGEQDQTNKRLVGQIDLRRTGELNNIEQQKALLANNTNNTLAQMAGDKESEIMALARQLEDRQFAKDMQNKDYGLRERQFSADQSYKQQQMAMQRAAQSAEQAYRMRQLSLQESAQGAENSYRNAMLAMQRDEFNLKKNTPSAQAIDALTKLADYDQTSTDSRQSKYEKMSSLANMYSNIPGFGQVASSANGLADKYRQLWGNEKYMNNVTYNPTFQKLITGGY